MQKRIIPIVIAVLLIGLLLGKSIAGSPQASLILTIAFAVGLLAFVRTDIALIILIFSMLFSPEREKAAQEATEPFGSRLGGALGRKWRLKPGGQGEAVFVVTWYFPALPRGRFARLTHAKDLRRSYADRFASAAAVAADAYLADGSWPRESTPAAVVDD